MPQTKNQLVTSPQCHQLPDEAYQQLVRTRDHLWLLTRLSAPHSPGDGNAEIEMPMSPASLSYCFRNLTEQLDGCLAKTFWPQQNMPHSEPANSEPEVVMPKAAPLAMM